LRYFYAKLRFALFASLRSAIFNEIKLNNKLVALLARVYKSKLQKKKSAHLNPINKIERQTHQFFSKEKLQNAENTIAKAQVQVKVINVDEPPVVSERRLFVDENLAPGTAIANSSGLAADPEGDSFR